MSRKTKLILAIAFLLIALTAIFGAVRNGVFGEDEVAILVPIVVAVLTGLGWLLRAYTNSSHPAPPSAPGPLQEDEYCLRKHAIFIATSFSREAFRRTAETENSSLAFHKALLHTAKAIRTGVLQDLNPQRPNIMESYSLSEVPDLKWYSMLSEVADNLEDSAYKYKGGIDRGLIHAFDYKGRAYAIPKSKEERKEQGIKEDENFDYASIDRDTVNCLKAVNKMLAEAGVHPLPVRLKARNDSYGDEAEFIEFEVSG